MLVGPDEGETGFVELGQPLIFQAVPKEMIAEHRMVGDGLVDDLAMDWPPFQLVAVEETGSPPALEHRRQLPAKVDGISNAHVHAVAAERGMQMARIADQEAA